MGMVDELKVSFAYSLLSCLAIVIYFIFLKAKSYVNQFHRATRLHFACTFNIISSFIKTC